MIDCIPGIRSLLLVDDDEDDALIFSSAVAAVAPGTKVHYRDSFFDLAHNILEPRPDLLFLDLNMPRRDGFEWLQYLRANGFKDTPIIIYSTSSSAGQIAQAYNRGADLYFVKPCTFGAIVAQLRLIFSLDWQDKTAIQEMARQLNSPHLRVPA